MKKTIFPTFVMLAALFGCQDGISEDIPCSDEADFVGKVEAVEGATKTEMGSRTDIFWSQGDQLAIFQACTLADKYQVTDDSAGKSNATFKLVSDNSGELNGDFSGGNEISTNIAVYPYSEGLSCLKARETEIETDAYEIGGVVLPSVQNYAYDSFGNGTFPMVAVTENMSDHVLKFKNVCGAMKLQLLGTDKVKSIKIEGKNNEILSGSAIVTAYLDNMIPEISMIGTDETCRSVVLDCGSGVELNETHPKNFIIALPPVVFSKGFVVTLTTTTGLVRTIQTDKENVVLRSSVLVMPEITITAMEEPSVPEGTAIDLSRDGTANCYIVSCAGSYRFTPTKGNSNESVGSIASAEVLWETFGTDVEPSIGDLIASVTFADGCISFTTPETFNEGNAVVAAKDADGNILWSWHIWITDGPQSHVYKSSAGTMMDRNLGATSATPGDVGALGLLYQWGRKDPFLGSSSISSSIEAKSTIFWPHWVVSNTSEGTIEYATANPSTFIADNSLNYDWYYTGSSIADNTRWTTTETNKSIYDPCPAGWRVPDGDRYGGVWSMARFDDTIYDSINEGISFGIYSPSTTWYPASGLISEGKLMSVGHKGQWWSASPDSRYDVYKLVFYDDGTIYNVSGNHRSYGSSVRCIQE